MSNGYRPGGISIILTLGVVFSAAAIVYSVFVIAIYLGTLFLYWLGGQFGLSGGPSETDVLCASANKMCDDYEAAHPKD